MFCVYDAEKLSFECIMDVVSEVRTGNVTVTTVRKVLKQIDSGLANFGLPTEEPGTLGVMTLEDVCKELEVLCDNTNATLDLALTMKLISLLMYLLDLLK